MKKKNFRELTIAPSEIAKCIGGCGLEIIKSEAKDRYWYVVGKNLYCCPNCDVTIIKK